jgi:hypothetical protein
MSTTEIGITRPLYDVIVFNRETRIIDHLAGTGLVNEKADDRLITVFTRINDRYGGAVVDAGKYNKGDTYPRP